MNNLEHNGSFLLNIDGNVSTGHPSVCAQVPESHIRVPKKRNVDIFKESNS